MPPRHLRFRGFNRPGSMECLGLAPSCNQMLRRVMMSSPTGQPEMVVARSGSTKGGTR